MQNHVRNIMSARPAMPPTTPPAMAPTGVDEGCCWEGAEVEDAAGVEEAEEGGIEEEGTVVAGSIKPTSQHINSPNSSYIA
jgi:hypothetical protein